MAIVVHHLERSRSHRVLWLLEELGLDYELRAHARDPKTMRAPAALREIHPLGKSPVVSDGDLVLAESGAILEHLVEAHGHGRLRPEAGTEAHRRYRFFLHYAEGSLMPPLLVRLITSQLHGKQVPFLARPIGRAMAKGVDDAYTNAELEGHARFLEAELDGRPFLTGEAFTAADIQMSYPLEAAAGIGLADGRPHIQAYLARLRERPAYAKAVSRGGPIMIDMAR